MEPISLLNALKAAVGRSLSGADGAGICYSGGLDSSLVAKLASELTETVCYACVIEGSHDAKTALIHGKADGFKVKALGITEEEFPSVVARTAKAIRSMDPVAVAYSIPTVVVLERSEEATVLAGNGADELFAGYDKYLRRPTVRESQMKVDLQKAKEETQELSAYASTLRKSLLFPYLAGDIIALAGEIPIEQMIAGDSRKAILREVGRLAGISGWNRPKKAAQYSSGTLGMMKALARREDANLSEWVRSVAYSAKPDKD